MKKLLRIIKWHIYCFLLNRKQKRCYYAGFPTKIRILEKRNYLTRDGIKAWNKLSMSDLIRLNIGYPYKDYINI